MLELDIKNIAGIRSGGAEVHGGLNVVRAQNWQGKSSFVKSLQVVMGTSGWGGEQHPLTDGETEGYVRLETDSDVYETILHRRGTTVRRDGTVYLDDEQDRLCARLFAFLGENNPVRAAVRNGEDLSSLLTKPLDVENIDEEIERLKRERRAVETELERAQDAQDRLTTVQREVTQLEDEIETLRSERAELEATTDESQGQDRLTDKRAQRDQLQSQIETLENKIDRKENRLQERQAELEDITIPDEPDLAADIGDKRERISELEQTIALLEDLYRVNKRVLDEGKADLVTEVERSLAGDEIECWLCGEPTAESTIADRLDAIEDRLADARSEKTTLQTEIEEIQDRRDEIRERRQRRADLEAEIRELQASLEEHRSRLAEMEERLANVTDELDDLRQDVEEANSQLTDLESEIKYKQNELADKRSELEQLEADAARRDQLATERDDLTSEIETLRKRRKEKQRELAERFEDTMADIINAVEPGFESARLTPITDDEGRIAEFDLVVAREGRETSRDALSEGEVELLGLVTALAGYETFDVADRVPLLLLDGLTALSKDNYHAVVEYLEDKPDYMVTTAYPELDEFGGHVLDPQDWQVVSNRQSSVS